MDINIKINKVKEILKNKKIALAFHGDRSFVSSIMTIACHNSTFTRFKQTVEIISMIPRCRSQKSSLQKILTALVVEIYSTMVLKNRNVEKNDEKGTVLASPFPNIRQKMTREPSPFHLYGALS